MDRYHSIPESFKYTAGESSRPRPSPGKAEHDEQLVILFRIHNVFRPVARLWVPLLQLPVDRIVDATDESHEKPYYE